MTVKYHLNEALGRNRTSIQIFDVSKHRSPKKQVVWVTSSQRLKRLPFDSYWMKGNVKVIHFQIKGRSMHSLVFTKITFTAFSKTVKLVKNDSRQFITFISIKRFQMFKHFNGALCTMKTCFYETSKFFFISSTRLVCAKLPTASESSIKIKFGLHWRLFVILLTSAVTCKQRLLHESEIVQFLLNCKCCNVD